MQTLNAMKHTLLIMAGFFSMIAYSSCKKEYACQCIHKYNKTDTVSNIISSTSEKKAETACKSGNGIASSMYDCALLGEDSIKTNKQ